MLREQEKSRDRVLKETLSLDDQNLLSNTNSGAQYVNICTVMPRYIKNDRYGDLGIQWNQMNEKSKLLYDLMLRKSYPEEFSMLIYLEMSTDFTAERMMHYVSGEKKRLEDVADEMVAIKDLRDRLINKHISEHAQVNINKLYREINE